MFILLCKIEEPVRPILKRLPRSHIWLIECSTKLAQQSKGHITSRLANYTNRAIRTKKKDEEVCNAQKEDKNTLCYALSKTKQKNADK